jgi:hypothetical protein
MLLIFKGVDKFGNWSFIAKETEQPISYYDLVEKKIDNLGFDSYNPIFHSQYKFCCINFKKQYDLSIKSFDTPVVGGLYKIKLTLTRHSYKDKNYVNANIIDLELIELPKEEEVLDF